MRTKTEIITHADGSTTIQSADPNSGDWRVNSDRDRFMRIDKDRFAIIVRKKEREQRIGSVKPVEDQEGKIQWQAIHSDTVVGTFLTSLEAAIAVDEASRASRADH